MEDLPIKTNGPKTDIYSGFNQIKDVIKGVVPIDYFFAKEVMSALTNDHQDLKLYSCNDNINNLYHLFLALSTSLRAGHSCLPLTEVADQHWGKGYARSRDQLDDVNVDSSLTGEAINVLSHVGFVFSSLTNLKNILSEFNIKSSDEQLVVFDNEKLYLRRYYQFEIQLGRSIKERLLQPCQYDDANIQQCIEMLFPRSVLPEKSATDNVSKDNVSTGKPITRKNDEIDWQKVAVANAINKNFSVIAGGPGTGKTYTVTKLLAALVFLEQTKLKTRQASTLNIALVAPTGKAAQRLSESIVDAVTGFTGIIDNKVLTEIPTQAQTIHRLLGVIPNSPNFRHHENNRLTYDVVLIDEVSMVDLPLMTRVFRALKNTTRVILLGDADQLPSVAAGSVLADIAPRPHGGYSAYNEQYLTSVCQLNTGQLAQFYSGTKSKELQIDYLSFLIKSRRFDGKGGIGLIANAVINGDVKSSWALLGKKPSVNTNLDKENQLSLAEGGLQQWLSPLVKQYYKPIESCTEVSEAFALLSKFRVLCATRQGEHGVENINEVIKSYLGKVMPLHLQRQKNQYSLYHGQPIMINENDYRLGLYNGDIGIIWNIVDLKGNKHLMACFESDLERKDSSKQVKQVNKQAPLKTIRKILPSRLPKFESVYAMTIHKTQGSEFSHVAMVLSDNEVTVNENTAAGNSDDKKGNQQKGSKLLTRELLYTGITRAKKQLTIATNYEIWKQGVSGQVKRHSGLASTLMTKHE